MEALPETVRLLFVVTTLQSWGILQSALDKTACCCVSLTACCVSPSPQLVLRAINSAHSAFLAVSLSSHFFESYNVFSQRTVVQAGVLIKVC